MNPQMEVTEPIPVERRRKSKTKLEIRKRTIVLVGIGGYLLVLCILAVAVYLEKKGRSMELTDANTECGLITESLTGFISNGTIAPLGFLPWYVSIRKKGFHGCGGTIISQNWIITASHCVRDENCNMKHCFTIVAGSQFKDKISTGTLHNVTQMEFPCMLLKSKEKLCDLVAMRVNPPFVYRKHSIQNRVRAIGRACLPEPNATITEKECQISGLGRQSFFDHYHTNQLMTLKNKIPSREDCQNLLFRHRTPDIVEKDIFCTVDYNEPPRSACKGDSGGPVTVERNNAVTLIGVVSRSLGCGFFLDEFTNVAFYRTWIKNITGV